MKKVTLILILIFTTSIYSQYNLQFNRVVNEQLNANNQMVTVPEGKVWKIQAFYSNGNGNTNSPDATSFSITKADGTYLSYRYFYANAMQNQTIWASAGDKISMAGSLPNSSNIMALNALEFNLSSVTSSDGSTGSSNEAGSTGTIVDNNGNSQEFVNTGSSSNASQWSTSNSSHTTYRDGTPIPQITNATDWDAATTGAWCYYKFDEANASYGKIYNFFAIVGHHDQDNNTEPKLFAPEGWRVPAIEDWIYLFQSLGGGANGGYDSLNVPHQFQGIGLASKLKSTTSWDSGYNGTNTSGFNVKAYGGYGYGLTNIQGISTNFGDINEYGVGLNTKFWSNSRRDVNVAYGVQFTTQINTVFIDAMNTHSGSAVYPKNGAGYVRLVVE